MFRHNPCPTLGPVPIFIRVGSSPRLFRVRGYLVLYQSVRVEPQHEQAHTGTTVGVYLYGLRACNDKLFADPGLVFCC